MCFHVNIVKFLRTTILKNICERVLLHKQDTFCPFLSAQKYVSHFPYSLFNAFHTNVPFLYSLNTSENHMFSNVFKG